MRKKISNIGFVLIVIFILAIVLFSAYFFADSQAIIFKELDVRFVVGDSYGFDLNSSALTFGKTVPGGSMVRKVEITNDFNFPVEVKVFASKNIVEFISTNSNFTLNPRERIVLPITLSVPEDMQFGNYSGKLRIEMHR